MVASLRVQRKRHRKLKSLERGPTRVKVGFPAGEASGNDISKAIWNEFGTRRGIPERPFMRNTMRAKKNTYRNALKTSAPKLLLGQTSMLAVLTKLGRLAQGHIQAEIVALSTPPNAPSTIRKKGSSNPLIDTGAMRQAVTWKIDR